MLIATEPLFPPAQVLTSVTASTVMVVPAESLIAATAVPVHPAESVADTVYEPADSPEALASVPPLDHM